MSTCAKCGNQNEKYIPFCRSCGSSLGKELNIDTVQSEAQPTEQDTQSEGEEKRPKQYPAPSPPPWQRQEHVEEPLNTIQLAYKEGHKYTVLGGWFMAIVIVNTMGLVISAISLFNSLGETIELFGLSTETSLTQLANLDTVLYMTLVGQIIGLVANGFLLIFLIQVFQRKSKFMLFGQLTQLTSIFVVILIRIIPFYMLGSEYMDTYVLSRNIGEALASVGGFFLYALYYSKSNRVRVYMGSDEYMSKALLAFKDQPPVSL